MAQILRSGAFLLSYTIRCLEVIVCTTFSKPYSSCSSQMGKLFLTHFLSEFDSIVLVIVRLFDRLLPHLLRNKVLRLISFLYHTRPNVLVVIWMLRRLLLSFLVGVMSLEDM